MLKKHSTSLLALAALCLGCFTSSAQSLVRDIRTGNNSSNPYGLTVAGSLAFFAANNGFNGTEIYKTDGTTSGTVMVRDINPASATSSSPAYLTALGNQVLFVADNGTNGFELWKSDGTTLGTTLVLDILAGANGANPIGLTAFNGAVYFAANDGTNGTELWRSDGTAAGTVLVKDIWAGNGSSSPSNFCAVGNVLYFQASDGFSGTELWKTDGTAGGTVLVKDIYSGFNSSNPTNLSNVGGTLYFAAETQTAGNELWKSNGTSVGTVLVADVNPGTSPSNPSVSIGLNGLVLFSANQTGLGLELFKTNGTSAGTSLVKDIQLGNGGSGVAGLFVTGGKAYFSANDGLSGTELWLTDGSETGTLQIADINPGSPSSSPTGFNTINGVLYFQATNAIYGTEMWRCDGTASGTQLVDDIALGTASSNAGGFCVFGTAFLFPANDGVNGRELWGYIPPPCVSPLLSLTVSGSMACYGDGITTNVVLSGAESGTNYQPFLGSTPIGAAVQGPGTLNLSMLTTALQPGTNVINILVTKSGCPAQALLDTAHVMILGAPSLNAAVTGQQICLGSGAQVTLQGSEIGVTYQAYINGAAVGAPLTATDTIALISIPSTSLPQGLHVVSIEATGTQGCPGITLTDTAEVRVRNRPNGPNVVGSSNCGAGQITLLANGAPGNGFYRWYTSAVGGNPLVGAVSNQYVTPNLTQTTTYYVTVVNGFGCESTPRVAVVATVNAVPLAPIATGAAQCGSGSLSLSASGAGSGEGYIWFADAAGQQPIAGATQSAYSTPVLTQSTTYFVGILSGAGCLSSLTPVLATINALPAAPAASGVSRCGAGPVVLEASGAGSGDTYQWYTGPLLSTAIAGATSASFNTPSLSASTTYYVGLVGANGCVGSRTAVSVVVNPIPAVATAIGASSCGPQTLTLSASGAVGNETIHWFAQASGGNPLASGSTYSTLFAQTTTLYVGIQNLFGCASVQRTAVTATIYAVPSAPLTADASRCGSGSLTLTASGASTGQNYQWFTANNPDSLIVGAIAATYTTGVLTQTRTYFVALSGDGGCLGPIVPVVATVNVPPAAPSAASLSRCGAGTLTLTAQVSGASTVQWFAQASGGSLLGSGAAYQTPTLTQSTWFFLQAQDANGCISQRDSVQAVILTLPAQVLGNAVSRCGPGTVTLNLSGATTGQSYALYDQLTGGQLIQSQSIGQISLTVSSNQTVYAEVVGANGCISSVRTPIAITVHPIPGSPTVTGASLCGSGSVTLSASGASGGQTYQWFAGSIGGSVLGSQNTFTTPVLSASANYYVGLITAQGCSSDVRTQVTATILPVPATPIVVANGPLLFCEGTSLLLAAQQVYAQYVWSNGQTTSAISVNQTGNYSLTVSNAAGCSASSTSLSVTVYPSPTPGPITASGPLSFCPGSGVTLGLNNPGGAINWSVGSVDNTVYVNSSMLVWATVINSFGCSANTDTVSTGLLPVPEAPVVQASSTLICGSTPVTLQSAGNYAGYLWSNGQTSSSISVSAAGDFTLQVSAGNGCFSSASDTVSVEQVPTPGTPVISAAASGFCAGSDLLLDAGSGYASYLWSNGATTSSIVVSSAGSYTVSVGYCNGGASISSQPFAVSVFPVPSSPTLSGPSVICAGQGAVLVAQGTGGTVQWSSGETGPSITVYQPGTFTAQFMSAQGCLSAPSSPLVLSPLSPPPTPVVTANGPVALCPGASVELSSNASGVSYSWSNGSTTASISVSQSGTYILTVSNGCTSVPSNGVTVTLNTAPALPLVSTQTSLPACLGAAVVLVVPAVAGETIAWSNGATGSTLSTSLPGSFSACATNAAGCQSCSAPFAVSFVSAPAQPSVVEVSTGVLGSTVAGTSYLWFFNGVQLPDTTSTLTPNANGNYQVQVFNGSCASDTSVAYTFLQTGTTHDEDVRWILFPNPSSEGFRLQGSGTAAYAVYDALGRAVLMGQTGVQGETIKGSTELNAGIYLVRIQAINQTWEFKWFKQ